MTQIYYELIYRLCYTYNEICIDDNTNDVMEQVHDCCGARDMWIISQTSLATKVSSSNSYATL